MLKVWILLILIINSLQSFQVNLGEGGSTIVRPGDIIRVDIVLTNPDSEVIQVISKIDSDRYVTPLVNGQTITINANSQKVLSYYLKINAKITSGSHDVTFRFYNSSYNYYVKKKLIVEKNESLFWLNKLLNLFVYD